MYEFFLDKNCKYVKFLYIKKNHHALLNLRQAQYVRKVNVMYSTHKVS